MPRLRLQVGGQLGTASDWSNTYEFLLSGSISSQATLQSIVNAVYTTLAGSSAYKTPMPTDTTTVNIKGLYYPSNTGASSFVASSVGAAFAGLNGPVHAPQVAVVASLRTNLAGRSYRGRLYFPYRGSGISALGVVASAQQTTIAAAVNAVVSAMVSALATQSLTCSWIVWSSKNGTGTPITAVLVGTQCDTIRHRNRNRNEAYASFTPPTTMVSATSQTEADQINSLVNSFVHAHIDPSVVDKLDDVAGLAVQAVFDPEE